MPDWRGLVEEYYALDCDLIMPPGASGAELDRLAAQLQIELPEDFVSFYRSMNGFGSSFESAEEGIEWAAVPLEQIPAIGLRIESWFLPTHPELAGRFIPFLDWHCGDATGYLFDPDGKPEPHLRTFFHEEYHAASQNYGEFLVEDQASIDAFLPRWTYIE